MKTTNTVCVSLEPRFVELLDRIARRVGSKSDAVRALLVKYQADEAERELEEAYKAYFADAAAARRERELTEEMLRAASWPEEPSPRGIRHGKRKKPPPR